MISVLYYDMRDAIISVKCFLAIYSNFLGQGVGLKPIPIKWLMFAIIKRIELLNIDLVAQMYVSRVQFVHFIYIFPFICCNHGQQVKLALVHANKPECK